jgi:deoxycytidylate deaminase
MQISAINNLQHIINAALRAQVNSPDDRARIGSVIFNKQLEILGIGWNAKPVHSKNFKTCVDPATDMSCHDLLHAEVRNIINIGKAGCEGNFMFVTNAPCMRCAGPIAEVDLAHVFYVHDHDDGIGVELLKNDYGVDATRLTSYSDLLTILNTIS